MNSLFSWLKSAFLPTLFQNGPNIDGLTQLSDEVTKIMNNIMGPIWGVVLAGAILVTIIYAVNGGFSSDADRRKKWIKSMVALWAFVGLATIVWSLSNIIRATFVIQPSSGGNLAYFLLN